MLAVGFLGMVLMKRVLCGVLGFVLASTAFMAGCGSNKAKPPELKRNTGLAQPVDSGNQTGGDTVVDDVLANERDEDEIIHDGFQAIYAQVFEPQGLSCFQDSDAKGNERLVLSETSSQVEYVLFDRRSANEKCLLYVQYRANKDADGSWSPADAQILDIYAYDEGSGAVVASGKKSWLDLGTQEYRDLTGE